MTGMCYWWANHAPVLGREAPCPCCLDLRERFERHEDLDDSMNVNEPYDAFVARCRASGREVLVSNDDYVHYVFYKVLMTFDIYPIEAASAA